ncbi:SRPBCC family protein [Saccharomonospora saliphila]|uniref:SRPBCC family protein n=1 Tax=Saccharomonospora saliphila TaxID=369829 RepID=UPI00037EB302|nr:SRPBCC family protein [Saccharomonospora saliphila]
MKPTLRPGGDGTWTLRFERVLRHPPETVWRALTDPDQLGEWYPLRVVALEPRVGGVVRFVDEEDTAITAEITEWDQPVRFAFREYDEAGGVHDLRFDLEPDGAGCRLRFRHTFADAAWAAPTAAGWHRCLDALEAVLDGAPVTWPDNGAELREHYAREFVLTGGAGAAPHSGERA